MSIMAQRQLYKHIFNKPLSNNTIHDALNSPLATELKTTTINAVYYRYLYEVFALEKLNQYLKHEQFKKYYENEHGTTRDSRKLFSDEQAFNATDLLNQLNIFYALFLLNTYYFASNNLCPHCILPFYRIFNMQKLTVLITHLKRIATVLAKLHLQLRSFF